MQVVIVDEHKYREFEPINEMIVNRTGAKLQPQPKFMISGLVDEEEYVMKLRIELVDNSRYTYRRNQWVVVSPSVKNAYMCKMSLSESRKELGSTWHSKIVQFDKMRITREFGELKQNMAYVEPGHKYIPILSIINVSTGVSIDYRFELLVFIAVKSYQSMPVRHAKRSGRLSPILTSNPVEIVIEEAEEKKSGNRLALQVLPQESQQQIAQFYPPPSYSYGYSNGREMSVPYPQHPHAYPFDQVLLYPQLQYPIHHALPYSIPFSPIPIQYDGRTNHPTNQQSIQEEEEFQEDEDTYTPEYGWNSILVPGCKNEHIEEDVHNLLGFHNDIWAPQEMELERLYYQAKQNYHPLEMN